MATGIGITFRLGSVTAPVLIEKTQLEYAVRIVRVTRRRNLLFIYFMA